MATISEIVGKACNIIKPARKIFLPGMSKRERTYPDVIDSEVTIIAVVLAKIKVLKVTVQI